MATDIEVSLVLPAYNEASTIRGTIETTVESLAAFLPDGTFEVIVADDGCDDRTPEIVQQIAETEPSVERSHSDERLGRGGALERAFELAHGGTLAYIDTDLATDMRHLEELIESVRSAEYDFATGSRWFPDRQADRPLKRRVPSYAFNGLARLLFGSQIRDHQCGFKAFARDPLFDVLDTVEARHWFWDTEVLVTAQRSGYRIREFPVTWTHHSTTKVRLFGDIRQMGTQLCSLWWRLNVENGTN